MAESSDSEVDQNPENRVCNLRLGKCEVCDTKDAVYTCPKCEVKTCCLDCVNIHKKELECDGVRDRTKFIHMKHFTNSDLLSDYRLLEECARFVYGKKRDEKKRFTRIDKDLPVHLYKLKNAARIRGTALTFLTQNFTRHANNTTFFDWKSNVIGWRVEWLFPNATPEAVKFVDERCPEVSRLSELLDKYLNPFVKFEANRLGFYHAAGFSGVKVLLKAEKIRGSSKKYFELDPAESLGDNLAGKCVVEYPVICVVLKDHALNFDIVASDDEFDCNVNKEDTNQEKPKPENVTSESNDIKDNLNKNTIKNDNITGYNNFGTQNGPGNSSNFDRGNGFDRRRSFGRGYGRQNGFNRNKRKHNENRELLTEKFAKEKKLEIEKEIKAEKKKKPRNLLFTTGYSSEGSLSDSDDPEKPVKPVTNK